jgi:hypothetical protein
MQLDGIQIVIAGLGVANAYALYLFMQLEVQLQEVSELTDRLIEGHNNLCDLVAELAEEIYLKGETE